MHTNFFKCQPLIAVKRVGDAENVHQCKMANFSELSFPKNKHTECNKRVKRENCNSALDLPGLESVDLTKMMES